MANVLSRPVNYLAMEVIDFQDNSFGSDLEVEVTKLVDKIINKIYVEDKDIVGCEETNRLEKIIFNRLGIRVEFETNRSLAAILPFYTNKHHILLQDYLKGDFALYQQEKILKKSVDKKGYVDTAKAKIGGIFSEYVHRLQINFNVLVNNYYLTPPEVVSIMLHELGHAFYAFEYSDRIDSNNQILVDVARSIFSDKKEKNMAYVYKELSKINSKLTEKEVELLVNGNRITSGYTWYKLVIEANSPISGSQLSNKKYDETSFEQLSDNFASRFGYGRQLIISLDKLKNSELNTDDSYAYLVFSEITSMLSYSLITILSLLAISSGYIIAPIVVISLLIFRIFNNVFVKNGEYFKNYEYDELKVRYKRIRHQYIEIIKNSRLNKDEYKIAIENIYTIDKIIDQTQSHSFIFNKIANLILNVNRAADNSIKEQQLLEDLAHNDLFLKSAELKAI